MFVCLFLVAHAKAKHLPQLIIIGAKKSGTGQWLVSVKQLYLRWGGWFFITDPLVVLTLVDQLRIWNRLWRQWIGNWNHLLKCWLTKFWAALKLPPLARFTWFKKPVLLSQSLESKESRASMYVEMSPNGGLTEHYIPKPHWNLSWIV